MQINGISASSYVTGNKNNSAASPKPALDQAVIGFSADSFSKLVKQASQMPEVRSEVVDAFKSRIQSGAYPPPEVIEGLTHVIGGPLARQAQLDSAQG